MNATDQQASRPPARSLAARIPIDDRAPQPQQVSHTTFQDVGGLDAAKEALEPSVAMLRRAKQEGGTAAGPLPGFLITGPPDSGKSLLTVATAVEADLPYYHLAFLDYVELHLYDAESGLRRLFETARRSAPCVLVLDKLEDRPPRYPTGDFDAERREKAIRQLVRELETLPLDAGVLLIATVTDPDAVDLRLLQTGRFERHIALSLPDHRQRREILRVGFRHILRGRDDTPAERERLLEELAEKTPGFTPRRLYRLAGLALQQAGKRRGTAVELADFEEAIEYMTTYTEETESLFADFHRVGFFRECRPVQDHGPCLHDRVGLLPLADKRRILRYLARGETFLLTYGVQTDVLSPDRIILPVDYRTDGVWCWPSTLIYYVRKYDIDMPAPLVDTMRRKKWRVPRRAYRRFLKRKAGRTSWLQRLVLQIRFPFIGIARRP